MDAKKKLDQLPSTQDMRRGSFNTLRLTVHFVLKNATIWHHERSISMSQKMISSVLAGACLVALLLTAFNPNTASAQQVLPGGRPARIQAFSVSVPASGTATVIPSVPGTNGFIVTDVFVSNTGLATTWRLVEDPGGSNVVKAWLRFAIEGSSHIGFESGIPFAAGVAVDVDNYSSASVVFSISGYTY